ncbi:MAG TPA: di-heme oxidoredictase family protein [Kofleriaceae bacterium]|nr:di-heme oxidoredictase family protein [Kofleriaceae bacterium]
MFGGALIAGNLVGCADPADATSEDTEALTAVTFNPPSTPSFAPAVVTGDPLPGISATDFAAAKANFIATEGIADGLGPIFNEKACGNCHTQGAAGGAGVQIERRFGKINADGTFNSLANEGGSLRQLMTIGSFTGANGQACNVPLEHEPADATIHNVGRLTTPLFGAGLIDVIPDSVIVANANNQAASVRGVVSRVPVLLPNPADPSQVLGATKVGRFGWKSQIASLVQFAADAYVNEMGITTQHCINGTSVLAFATESKPNGIAQPAGCDDLGPGGPGIPAGTDDGVGSCAGGLSEIQDDVNNFFKYMTFLAPAPRLPIDAATDLQGGTVFNRIGCASCHLLKDYVTPASPANGVPGNFSFRPRTDFLLHDMGSLGDGIGNDGDSVATTHLMRTAPLWGLHLRTKFLHDGRATSITQAIQLHGGQAAASVQNFNALGFSDRNAMLTAMMSD